MICGSPSHIGTTVESNVCNLTTRRLTGALLALRLYQLDHAGQLPKSLSELVGRELKTLPLDPYVPGAKPIGYVKVGSTCFVYSISTNGTDETAAGRVPTTQDHHDFNKSDYILFFDRSRYTPPAALPPIGVTTTPTSSP